MIDGKDMNELPDRFSDGGIVIADGVVIYDREAESLEVPSLVGSRWPPKRKPKPT
jgi:hypothetical protein